MALSVKADHLARYKDIVLLLVKYGRSTRADLLPPVFLDAFTRLQDKVEPFPFLDVEPIVTAELGVKISKAFAEFEKTPVAAASLGQVHRAALRNEPRWR